MYNVGISTNQAVFISLISTDLQPTLMQDCTWESKGKALVDAPCLVKPQNGWNQLAESFSEVLHPLATRPVPPKPNERLWFCAQHEHLYLALTKRSENDYHSQAVPYPNHFPCTLPQNQVFLPIALYICLCHTKDIGKGKQQLNHSVPQKRQRSQNK